MAIVGDARNLDCKLINARCKKRLMGRVDNDDATSIDISRPHQPSINLHCIDSNDFLLKLSFALQSVSRVQESLCHIITTCPEVTRQSIKINFALMPVGHEVRLDIQPNLLELNLFHCSHNRYSSFYHSFVLCFRFINTSGCCCHRVERVSQENSQRESQQEAKRRINCV